MKFCAKCGQQMEDNLKFCPACGAEQNSSAELDPVTAVKDSFSKNKKLIAKIGIIALAAIIVVILLVKIFTPGYKKAADKYLDAFADLKVTKMMDMLPEFVFNDYDKDQLRDIKQEIEDEMEDEFKDIKISFTITDTEKMDKDAIENIEERADNRYDETIKVKKGYYVTAKMTAKHDGEKMSDYYGFQVIKIGSKWYIYDTSFMNLFY